MKKMLVWGLMISIMGALAGVSVFLFLKVKSLRVKLEQNQHVCERLSQDINDSRKEKEEIINKSEQLNSEVVSSLGLSNKLRQENKELKKELEPIKKDLEEKEQLLKKLKQDIIIAQEKTQAKEAQTEKFKAESVKLKEKIVFLEKSIQREKVDFYYNLGVAYTKAKMYEQAIKVYEQSLDLDAENPEANYNLGLIYQNIKKDTQTAVAYYQRYLELIPDGEEAQEIEELIMELTGRF
ncbi:MAG: tetratricopeptide repeat protein [Candidatus Omnitrophota bacterium]